jgi:hypothetical protein
MRCPKVLLLESCNRMKKAALHRPDFTGTWKTCFVIESGASNNARVWRTMIGQCVTLALKRRILPFLCTFYSKISTQNSFVTFGTLRNSYLLSAHTFRCRVIHSFVHPSICPTIQRDGRMDVVPFVRRWYEKI